MGTVSDGADTGRLRRAGQQLSASSDRLAELATSGRAMTRVLADHWAGVDLEYFVGQGWPGAEQVVHDSSQMVRAMGEAATRNADQQDDTSAGGASPGGPGGPGGAGRPGDGGQGDDGQSRPAEHYGELPPEVRERWDSYTDDEKRMIVREMVRERAEHYGIDTPSVRIDDSIDGNGVWRERGWLRGDQVVINEDVLDDPMVLHTVFHEMRHAAQHEAISDAETFWWWEDPEYNHGMTPEEVQEWKENFDDYQPAPSQEEWDNDPDAAQEKYDRYFDQPVEVDAREEGSDFVEGMTPEELDRLLVEAQERRDALDYDGPNPMLPH